MSDFQIRSTLFRSISTVGALWTLGCADSTGNGSSTLELPLRDRIVFSSNRTDSLFDIYTVKLDGSDGRRLSGDGTADTCPALSPDGNWIAYYERDPKSAVTWYSVILMRANGTDRKVLANAEPPFSTGVTSCPTWSEDSKFVLYPKLRPDAQGLLKVFNTAGDSVWAFRSNSIGSARLSPDGSGIALVTWLASKPHINFDVAIVTQAGIRRTLSRGRSPTWSPSGAELAFSCTAGPTETVSALCAISPEGQNQHAIVPTPGLTPLYSPDGNMIAFGCTGIGPPAALCFVTRDGVVIGQTSGVVISLDRRDRFAWSRKSDFVVFDCQTTSADLCMIRPDGSGLRNITQDPAFDTTPSLSPTSGN